MTILALYLIVSISGGCVLAIEILGTRILGPFYGVSLFLWSALISVTLAALSLGYVIGGRWADRGPQLSRLALLLTAAGLWMVLVPWLKNPLLGLTEDLGLRFAVLATAFILFFPPLTLLGMVSPYAIRIRARRLEEVGRTAGDLYAVSTIASVVAALSTGFWLIPNMGVTRLTIAIGVLLLAAALTASLAARKGLSGQIAVVAVGLIGAAGLWWIAAADARLEEGLQYVGQSAYAEIRVLDDGGLRYLLIDGGTHSIVEPETWLPHHDYVLVSELVKEFFEEPGRLLLIGLGGGSVAKVFAQDGWKVDAVEIDPVVTEIAHDYFGLLPSEAEVHHLDGRRFLRTTDQVYDVIELDAFGSSSIPFHLTTVEAFELVRSRLAADGVLSMNIEAVGWHHPLVHSLVASLRPWFEHVVVLPIAEPPSAMGNLVIFASNVPMEISDEALGSPLDTVPFSFDHYRVNQRNHAWDNRFVPDTEGVRPLTDDRNPVDLWSDAINLVARADLHEFFRGGRSW